MHGSLHGKQGGAAGGGDARPLKGAVILVGESFDTEAGVARSSLRRAGAADVIWRRTIKGFEAALAEGGIDIALIDMGLQGGDAAEVASRLRFGELGGNPFLPLIITTWRPDPDTIDAALRAGADDVLIKPLTASMAAKRIRRLGTNRKPFIAADGYVGPVRANMPERLAETRTFNPPNTLKALVNGDAPDAMEIEAEFEEAQRRLASLRVEVATRAVASIARGALTDDDVIAPNAVGALKDGANTLRELLESLTFEDLRSALERLAQLADLAAEGSGKAAQAAKLTIEIADAITLLLTCGSSDIEGLPSDIIQRIDSRFPELTAA